MKSIEEIIQDLYKFAEDPRNLIIRDFIAQQKLSQNKFTTLLTNNPDLLEAYNYARLCVGIRREKKALNLEISPQIYRDTQPIYDDDLKNWEMEKKKGILTIEEGAKKLDAIFAKSKDLLSTESKD